MRPNAEWAIESEATCWILVARVTGGYRRLHRVTRGYKGLKGVTGSYKRLQRVT